MNARPEKRFSGAPGPMLRAHLRLIAACAVVYTLCFLGSAAIRFMENNLLEAAPRHELRVGLRTRDVAILRMSEPGAKTAFTAEDLAAMTDLEGVVRVFPIRYADVPSEISVDLFGQGFDTQMVFQAFEPEWIAEDVAPDLLVWEEGRALPVVVNARLLSIYNNAYARSRGLPELSGKALEAPMIQVTYGAEPETADDPEPLLIYAKVVGLSPRVALGMAIPRPALEQLHAELGLPIPAPLEAVLQLRANADVDRVRTRVEALGFTVLEADPLARLIRQVDVVSRTALWFLVGCLLLFTLALLDQTLENLYLVTREDLRTRGEATGKTVRRFVRELLKWQVPSLVLAIAIGYAVAFWLNAAWLSPMLAEVTGATLTPHVPFGWTLGIALAVVLTAQISLLSRLVPFLRER